MAVRSRQSTTVERNYTAGKIKRLEREINASIQRYLDSLETIDRTQPVELKTKTERLQGKIEKMGQRLQEHKKIKAQVEMQSDKQLSLTDPDARAMTTHSMKGILNVHLHFYRDPNINE